MFLYKAFKTLSFFYNVMEKMTLYFFMIFYYYSISMTSNAHLTIRTPFSERMFPRQ